MEISWGFYIENSEVSEMSEVIINVTWGVCRGINIPWDPNL